MSDFMDFDQMIVALREAREATLRMLDWVRDPERLAVRANPDFRPILWHLGHLGAFQEWWLLMKLRNRPPINPRFQVIFDPIKIPREDPDTLPSRAEIESYLEQIQSQYEDIESGTGYDAYTYHLVLEHEYQHQETLAMLMQMLPPETKSPPLGAPASGRPRGLPAAIPIPHGAYTIGAPSTPRSFVYDNELPRHTVTLDDFTIDRYPVTNAEFADFLVNGGYDREDLWSREGWEWKQANEVTRPLYWSDSSPVSIQFMFEMRDLDSAADHPVTGVSWHEAEAFARFAGKRLPTEAEWEAAASPVTDGNFAARHTGTTPVGAFPGNETASGCFDMTGNLWEWTSSTFGPYPGFKPHPYPEYSELWFDGDHRVLKGGSWMTQAPLLRLSFRNFFRPGFRYAFAGFRCAAKDSA